MSSIISSEKKQNSNDNFYYLNYPKKGYLFIITYGRSGSTLTSNYVNKFPGYCIRGENNNVVHHLCSAIQSLNNINFKSRRENKSKPLSERRFDLQKIMETSKDPWYGAELVDPDNFAKRLFDNFVKDILSLPLGTRVAGFKEIRWAENLPQLHDNLDIISKYFPKVKFIFQTRDADELAKSGWWKDKPIDYVRDYVSKADAAFLSYVEKRDACLHIKYEDFTKGDMVLKKIAEFLGEEFCSYTAREVINEKLTHLKSAV